jgi:hypothetical protein
MVGLTVALPAEARLQIAPPLLEAVLSMNKQLIIVGLFVAWPVPALLQIAPPFPLEAVLSMNKQLIIVGLVVEPVPA